MTDPSFPRREALPLAGMNADTTDVMAFVVECIAARHRICFVEGRMWRTTKGATTPNPRLDEESDCGAHIVPMLLMVGLPIRYQRGDVMYAPHVSWASSHDPSGAGRSIEGRAS